MEQAQLAVPCGYCDAAEGEWCRAKNRRWYTHHLHSDRYWQVWPIVRPVIEEDDQRLREAYRLMRESS